MNRKKRLGQTVAIVAVILILVTLTQREIDRFRKSEGAAAFQVYKEMDLASFAGTVLLAGFRGLAVDILWIRSLHLMEQHEWFELSALYKLISKLQPNFPSVWVFNSWNLSHNISVHWDSKEDKWRWFKAGIDFAKEGLEKNPNSTELLFWLGLLYHQRIYRYVDPMHPDQQPYFLRQVEETEGKSAPEMALKYFTLARQSGRHGTFAPFAVDASVAHAMGATAWYAFREERNLEKAITYMEKAAAEWKKLVDKYPEKTVLRSHYQEAVESVEWLSNAAVAQALQAEAMSDDAVKKRNLEKAITYMKKAAAEWKKLVDKNPEKAVLRNRYEATLYSIERLRKKQEEIAP